jgi:ADP-ribosylglycohydrolase
MSRLDQIAGCLLGQAAGDALGFVVEARPPTEARRHAAAVLRRGAAPAARPPHAPGQYSDDTQLARELALSLAAGRGWDPADYAGRIAALFAAGADVGAGPGTRGAAVRLLVGVDWREAGTPAPYAGNGSAMRAAPVGLIYARDPARLRRVAAEQSRVTHRDPRCAAGAVAVAGAVALALPAGPLDRGAFVETLSEWVRESSEEFGAALARVADWLPLAPAHALSALRRSGLGAAPAGRWRGISPFVLPSVTWAIYAFLHSPDDYADTLHTALFPGGDTDTMAAMAGAISGARLGIDAVPPRLRTPLHDRGAWDQVALLELAARLHAATDRG